MLKKSLKEIANLLYCSLSNEEEITHVAFDSREVKKSSLFFAIKGAKVDGHQFLEEVARRGALGAVVEKSYRGPHFGLSLLFVDEVKGALQQLAQVVHQEGTPFVIGVTGTIGKTTTKEFIATLLREKVSVYATPGNANSQLSLPVTLLNRKEKAEVLVLEMGMSLPGELRRLTEIAPPDLGVLTKLTLVHGDSFNSLEEIAEAKKELFEAQSVKRAILNKQTTAFTPIQKIQLPTTFYSVNDPEADLFLYVEKERVFVQEKRAKEIEIALPFRETQFMENFLGAATVARAYGLTWEEIQRGAHKLRPFSHRFEKIEKGGILFIDDTYNAPPASVINALQNLPKPKGKGKKIAVLGAIKVLGSFTEKSHEEVGNVALSTVDMLLCYGEEWRVIEKSFRKEKKEIEFFFTLEEIAKRLEVLAEPGDVVLVKGSNLLKMWTLFDLLKIR